MPSRFSGLKLARRDSLGRFQKGSKYSPEEREAQSKLIKKLWRDPIYRKNTIEGLRNKEFSEEHRKKLSENNIRYWKGKKLSEEHRRKMSESRKGEKHWNWQGGISPENNIIRGSAEYKSCVGSR